MYLHALAGFYSHLLITYQDTCSSGSCIGKGKEERVCNTSRAQINEDVDMQVIRM